jgi:hypothetical protein
MHRAGLEAEKYPISISQWLELYEAGVTLRLRNA